MERAEYMKIRFKYFPAAIRQAYNPNTLLTRDDWIYTRIINGMYGLKQVARIAYDLLKTWLAEDSYTRFEEMWTYGNTNLTSSNLAHLSMI